MEKDQGFRGPPWGRQPSLEAVAEEVGVDFDAFLAFLKKGATDSEMAAEFGVSPRTIHLLRNRFERFGIDSIMGQD
ncbi:MAG: helix-turn-helix domain-containing protein [Firmicutes bacterium]|nr:helix-turn-helix domain-containing protein [Bacillota bacterium]